jgi:hypothetical protein
MRSDKLINENEYERVHYAPAPRMKKGKIWVERTGKGRKT